MREMLADRNMRILFAGQSVNMLGNSAMMVVLGIWVKDLTGSSGDAGLVFLLLGATSFLAPVTGLVADRFPRRLVLIVSDSVTGAIMALLLLVHDRSGVWIIYLVAAFYGTSGQIYRGARGGLIHSMVSDEQLGDANGMLSSLAQGLRIVAPLIGAGIYAALGGPIVALADIGTFAFSVISYLLLRPPPDPAKAVADDRPEGLAGTVRDLLAGVRHVVKQPDIRRMIIASSVAFAGAGMVDVAMFSLVDQGLHRTTAVIGVLTSLEGAGGVVAGLASGMLMRRFGEYAVASTGFLLLGAAMGVSATATLPGVIAGGVLIGLGVPLVLIAELTIVQRRSPAELQGRAIAASEALTDTPFTISIAVGAGIIGIVGYRLIYLGVAVGFLVVGFALLPYLKITLPPRAAHPDPGDQPASSEPVAEPSPSAS